MTFAKNDLVCERMVLLNLQSPINIGFATRSCEAFQIPIDIIDGANVLQDADKYKTAQDFSTGSLGRMVPYIFKTYEEFKAARPQGRIIATCLDDDSVRLPDFTFAPDDIVIIGNEYDGVPREIIDAADVKLYIPMPPGVMPKPMTANAIDPTRKQNVAQEGKPNLNAATAAAIFCYGIYLDQLKRGTAQ